MKRLEGRIERLFKMLKLFSFWIFLLVARGCQLREAMSVEYSDFHFFVMILLANFLLFQVFGCRCGDEDPKRLHSSRV